MIPLKIETLLEGRVVEHDRVEYKTGWNPNEIIHSICAFANDYDNTNGGYIVIGVKEKNGMPVFPLEGVPKENLDAIQQEIFQYCNMIVPRYIPRMEVVDYQKSGTFLIYLWCSAGDSGPYQAPKTVYIEKGGKNDKNLKYWIRPASLTTEAKQDEISELFDKFNSVPFDDRVNRRATIENIRRGYLEDFIRKSNSSLVQEINNSSLEELLLAEEVANETDTELDIRNIGVLMFAEHPEKLIPGAQIELIRFNSEDAEASDDFVEKIFTGPIWKQVQDVLDYINTTVIEEKVVKIQGKAESERFYNYPYNALEEALVNAVFHKSYRDAEPVEIRIYVDSIQIINYPGLAKWINFEKFSVGKIRGRKYRNRRIGELFKEIDLSEKKGTGISKILRELKQNGSPKPEFEMDEERNYLNTIIHIHEGFEKVDVVPEINKNETSFETSLKQVLKQKDLERLYPIVEFLDENKQITIQQVMELLNKSRTTAWRYMKILVETGLVEVAGSTNNIIYKLKV